MTCVHPSAVVSSQAVLGRDIEIGPFCIIEDDVRIGDGCRLAGHVTVKRGTTLGEKNRIFEGAVLGGLPQHIQRDQQLGRISIGDNNEIREYVTIHCALDPQCATIVGQGNLIMVGAHVAHDCHVGNHTILTNGVLLAGHVVIEDRVYLSGDVGIHQFCRVGAYAMVGGKGRVMKDVPPYVTVDGISGHIVGLNLVGLRRGGFGREEIRQLKDAYRIIYRSGLKWSEVLDALKAEFPSGPAAAMWEFLSTSRRGFTPERRVPRAATLKLHRDEEQDGTPGEFRAAG